MAADAVRAVAEQNPADIEALAACKIGDATLEEVRKGLVGKIGENMTFRRFTRVEAKGELNSYIHGSKIGVIVDVIGGNAELSHDVAMHIAAAKPKALDETGVDQAQIEAERRIAIEKAREAGKPEAMLERIAEVVKAAGAQIGGYTLFVVGEGIEKRVDDFAAEVAAQVAAAKA